MCFAVNQQKHADETMNKENATVNSSVLQTIVIVFDIIISMYFNFYIDYKHYKHYIIIVTFWFQHCPF